MTIQLNYGIMVSDVQFTCPSCRAFVWVGSASGPPSGSLSVFSASGALVCLLGVLLWLVSVGLARCPVGSLVWSAPWSPRCWRPVPRWPWGVPLARIASFVRRLLGRVCFGWPRSSALASPSVALSLPGPRLSSGPWPVPRPRSSSPSCRRSARLVCRPRRPRPRALPALGRGPGLRSLWLSASGCRCGCSSSVAAARRCPRPGGGGRRVRLGASGRARGRSWLLASCRFFRDWSCPGRRCVRWPGRLAAFGGALRAKPGLSVGWSVRWPGA